MNVYFSLIKTFQKFHDPLHVPIRKATFSSPFSSDPMFKSHSAEGRMYAFTPY